MPPPPPPRCAISRSRSLFPFLNGFQTGLGASVVLTGAVRGRQHRSMLPEPAVTCRNLLPLAALCRVLDQDKPYVAVTELEGLCEGGQRSGFLV